MERKRFCIYRVEYKGMEIGYVRVDIDSFQGRLVSRSLLADGYTSYACSVMSRMNYYYKFIYDKFVMELVDSYDEYIL